LKEVTEMARAEGKTPDEVVEEAARELLRHRKAAAPVPSTVDETRNEPRQRRADFSSFVGRWTDDPEFDEIMAAQRQIDPELWK